MTQPPKPDAGKQQEQRREERRRKAPTRLAAELPALTKMAFRNTLGGRGFAEAGLITEWPAIVGAEVARMSRPLQLAFRKGERKGGVLTIQCGGAAALELQHLKPQILERINSHFGYAAIAELRFKQGAAPIDPAAGRRSRTDSKPASPADRAAVAAALAGVKDGEIKERLERLGLAIRRRQASR
jgi:hypothetical protein